MLITRKKFEETLHRERERVFQEVELNRRIESMERWLNERMDNIEKGLDSRISKLEKHTEKLPRVTRHVRRQ